jgi:hypothetical protein
LESKVREEIIKNLATETLHETFLTSALECIIQSDIYQNTVSANIDPLQQKKIDMNKLDTVLQSKIQLRQLRNEENFGVQVVAYFIRRYQQMKQAFSCTEQPSEEKTSMNTSNGNSKSPGSAGGGEVFRAFTTNGTCVITEDFIKKVEEIAAIESKTDFYRTTLNGTRFHNYVEEQIQVHMDAYCKGHKSRFKGELYKDAKDHIEVYVKLMYYVQRGLITSFEDEGEKFINASWGEISKFCFVLFCFVFASLVLACLNIYVFRLSKVIRHIHIYILLIIV